MEPVAGVVAEYNPFHCGHAHHLARTREALPGAAVVCAMSGHVTQRGQFALCEKHARARMAVAGGADLVLELPAVCACASAERFARAGVALLAATGVVTHLSFGSEAGTLAPLREAARAMADPDFLTQVKAQLRRGLSHAAACQQAYEAHIGRPAPFLRAPNNILGLEYLKALHALGDPFIPLTVPRLGADHDDPRPRAPFASASLLRNRLSGGLSAAGLFPPSAQAVWEAECAAGRAPMREAAWADMCLSHLRRLDAADFARLPDVTEGLEFRLASAARRAATMEAFYRLVATRRYTLARVRRVALCAFLGLTPGSDIPPYLRVLAAGPRGLALLRRMKQTASQPILVKPASARTLDPGAVRCFAQEVRVTDLFALGYPNPACRAGGGEWTTGPVIHSAVHPHQKR
ncbi:MAG: nucleotidyltransferase family protein [Oscillospiraceae bacterium]|jgi:predicted nucleotidyltransferase|nr:nucleotidyltransferase family protein [Oscillospiraceae bacterium]